MKPAILAAMCILFATAAQADSTVVVDATASSICCYGLFPPPAMNLTAQMTLEQVTGEFLNPGIEVRVGKHMRV